MINGDKAFELDQINVQGGSILQSTFLLTDLCHARINMVNQRNYKEEAIFLSVSPFDQPFQPNYTEMEGANRGLTRYYIQIMCTVLN